MTIYCSECGKRMKSKRGKHHYVESGLDNFYLENILIHTCACGYYEVDLPAFMNLQELICKILVSTPFQLSGKEIRFLRTALGLRAKKLAKLLGVSPETVSRWENNKVKMNKAHSLWLKSIVNDHFSREKKKIVKMLEDIALTEEQALRQVEEQLEKQKTGRRYIRTPLKGDGEGGQLAMEICETC